MDRQAFRDQLHSALRGSLLSDIQQYVDDRFEAYQQFIRYISALDRRYEGDQAIKEGLPGILKSLGKEINRPEDRRLSHVYISTVEKLAEQFPEHEIWDQAEDRFKVLDEDSLLLSVGKGGKKLARSTARTWHSSKNKVGNLLGQSVDGWKPWTQNIPLQGVIKSHLLSEEMVHKWIDSLERFQLKMISDIEEVLVGRCRGNSEVSFQALAEEMQQKLDSYHENIQKKIDLALNTPESEILWVSKKVGTIERSESHYGKQRVADRSKNVRRSLQKTEEEWIQALNLLFNRTQDIARFYSMWSEIQEQCSHFVRDFHSYFEKEFAAPFQQLHRQLNEAIEKVEGLEGTQQIQSLKDNLKEIVGKELISSIRELKQQEVLAQKTEHFFEELLLEANRVSQHAVFLFDVDLDSDPPEISHRQMEWRLLVVRMIRENIMGQVQPSKQQYDDFLFTLLQDLNEVESVIEVNLESAIAAAGEDSSQEESPSEIARDALQRLVAKVEELQARSDQKREGIEQAVTEGEELFRQSLLALLHDGDARALQLVNAKYSVKETTKGWQSKLDSRVARMQDRVAVWSRFGLKKTKEYTAGARKLAGFKDETIVESQRANIASYLSETDQKMNELPYIYRRLFNFDAKADQRFYVPVTESAATFRKAYEQWQQGFPATVAIVGEKGSGKSTFLNLMADTQFAAAGIDQIFIEDTIASEDPLVRLLTEKLAIPDAGTIDDIIEVINQAEHKRAIILEGFQNCFIRTINGYEAIEKLSYLISETKSQVFWIVSCSRYAWRFLDKTAMISEYFSHIIRTDIMSDDQIENIIMNRHRASGYSLQFEPGESMLGSRAYRKLKDQEEKAQEYLKEDYFTKLALIAEGNASIAMIFWIRSISTFDDTCFYMRPLEVTSIEIIEDLSPPVLFTLAAFVLHDTVSDSDLSQILNLSHEESRLMLIRLHSRGLLEKTNGYYILNHLMYRQIVRVLKERNIIHLV